MVQVGTFGEIKKTMRLLSKRDSHIDMEFVCGENQDIYLQAHRFIISFGNQEILRELACTLDSVVKLCFPDYLPI